ncbi:MAG: response regulator [Myxococcales bacterium]
MAKSSVMYERSDRNSIPIESVALPVALLEEADGRLWVRAASKALLVQAGVARLENDAPLGFEPTYEPLAHMLARFDEGADEVLVPVAAVGATRAMRGQLALRRVAPARFVGVWSARENDWRFEQIVQKSPDVIAIIDRQFRHAFVNEAIRPASGMTPADFEGKDHRQLGLPEDMVRHFQDVYRRVFETGQEGRKDFEFMSANGELLSYSSRVVPLIGPDGSFDSLLSCARDVTERKREEAERLAIERKLQETQRLESLGLLAGGAAHDFNNLLTAIMGMTSVVQHRLGTEHAMHPLLSKILLSCERASSLCTQMLAYAQLQQVSKERVGIRELLELTSELLRVSMPKNITLTFDLVEPAHIQADRSQIQQVLLNLLLNAVEAIEGQNGQILVQVSRPSAHELEFRDAVVVPTDPQGPLWAIRISDTGVGMDATTVERIFEPFFTTKFTGRGLGLSATLGIVQAHGGGLTVRTEVGRGSVFTLYLSQAGADTSGLPAGDVARSGDGRILLVDDEPGVREATAEMLRDAGYEVTLASNGSEALSLYDSDPEQSDMVLLDLTMPGLDGFQTLTELRARDARLPVVLMSGYAEDDVRSRAAADPAIDFLQKPFRQQQLWEICALAVTKRFKAASE